LLSNRLSGIDGTTTRTIALTGLAGSTAYNAELYNGWYAQTYSAEAKSAATDPFAGTSANNNHPNWTEGVEQAVLR
jgi:hypothetical protein